MNENYCSRLTTPIGQVTILASDTAIHTVTFSEKEVTGLLPNTLTQQAAQELQDYLDGKLQVFTFPMAQKGTDFQKGVWNNLMNIGFGDTVSYAKFSEAQPLAIRAIAAANGKNNIAIAVPCHRVIGSDGKLVGYAGGLWRKQWLLQHEREVAGKGQTELKF